MVYAVSHNAMSNAEENWSAPNQRFPIITQLNDGIRGLMLDVYESGDQAVLCHSSCVLGRIALSETLGVIRSFLNENPEEIITIIFESYASAKRVKDAFEESQTLELTYAHKQGDPWPTVQELAAQNRRLVVFTDHEGGAFPWYHDVWSFAWETHWSYEKKEDLDCKINRGHKENDLMIMNHFLTAPIALESLAETVNDSSDILARAEACAQENNQRPNFIVVDFYSIGGVVEAVRILNTGTE